MLPSRPMQPRYNRRISWSGKLKAGAATNDSGTMTLQQLGHEAKQAIGPSSAPDTEITVEKL
jgi:hypothetical protein